MTPKPKRRLQLAAAVQTFKIFLKTEKLVLFCQINLNKSTAFSPVWVKSGSSRMTKEMRLIFEKGKWNDKRDTPAAAPPPCRLHFLMFSALHAEKAAFLRRKNAFGRTTALLAPRMPSQNKKAIPYGMTFCFGGDKRDRTADLMTASCDRFVILSVFTSNPSVPSAKSAGFYSDLSTASTCFHAHLGHNPGQKIQSTQTVVRILIKLILGFVIRSKAIDQISKEYRGHFIFRDVYL